MDQSVLLEDLKTFLSKNKIAIPDVMLQVCEESEDDWNGMSVEDRINQVEEIVSVGENSFPYGYEDHIKENKMPSFSETLLNMIDQKEMKDSDVYRRAGIDRRLFWKIRNDDTYQTSKRTVFALILSLRLSEEESEELLESAGYSFSRSQEYDLIILFFVRNAIYDFELVNYALMEHRLQPLGCIEG